MAKVFRLHTGAADIQGGTAGSGGYHVVNASENGGAVYHHVHVVRHKNVNAPENGGDLQAAVLGDQSFPQVVLHAPEHGADLCPFKGLLLQHHRLTGEGGEGVPVSRILKDKGSGSALAEDAPENHLKADNHNNSRHQQLPQLVKAHHVLAGQQQKHADGKAHQISRFVPVGHKPDGTGDDEKQRPPAVKENGKIHNVQRPQPQQHAHSRQHQTDAEKRGGDLLHALFSRSFWRQPFGAH